METTIEYRENDVDEIQKMWGAVHEVLKIQNQQVRCPTLLFANTIENKPFWYFEGSGSEGMVHVTEKDTFDHESYTSIYFLRAGILDSYPYPDKEELLKQLELYHRHLELIEDFLDNAANGTARLSKEYPEFHINLEE